MNRSYSRRQFLHQVASSGAVAAGLAPFVGAGGAEPGTPKAPANELIVISGKPRERGWQYGQRFKTSIPVFLEREIVEYCAKQFSRDELLRYASLCIGEIRKYSPIVMEELEGMAEGSGMKLEELVLITLHEETTAHRDGKLLAGHCTTLAAAPPETTDGHSYVGQTWDWSTRMEGLSSMLLWKLPDGPSVLAYSYPGTWVGAGLNSAGIALCWTSADGMGIKSPRIGIPSYVLIAQMLYQNTLEAALKEAERAKHAGWFSFLMADGKGNLATVQATPEKLVIKRPRGHTAEVGYSCREILGGTEPAPLKLNPRCQGARKLMATRKGKFDRSTLQGFLGNHESGICRHPAEKDIHTIETLLFDCTSREAHISPGPGCKAQWKTFGFDKS